MPIKKRKSLDDALAQEFVYGDNDNSQAPSPITQPIEEKEPAPKSQEKVSKEHKSQSNPSVMDKLQPVEPREATKRFTVDLPDSMHRKLSILAAKTGRTKADIVRVLLDDVLKDIED